MPCCSKDYVQASFVLGIVLAVLSLLTCFGGGRGTIIHGIFWALISGILIFGAKMRNPTAILVWMVFAIIEVVWLIVVAVMAIIAAIAVSGVASQHNLNAGGSIAIYIVFIIFVGALILFKIWTIIVAKKAREEIQVGGTEGVVFNKA